VAESTPIPTTTTRVIQSSEGAANSSITINLASSYGSFVTVSGPEAEISYEYRTPTPTPVPTIDRPEIQSEQASSEQVKKVVDDVVSQVEAQQIVAQQENWAISTKNLEKTAQKVPPEESEKVGIDISSTTQEEDDLLLYKNSKYDRESLDTVIRSDNVDTTEIVNWKTYRIAISQNETLSGSPYPCNAFDGWNGIIQMSRGSRKWLSEIEAKSIIQQKKSSIVYPWLTICPINDKVGLGVRALVDIPKNGFLCEYG